MKDISEILHTSNHFTLLLKIKQYYYNSNLIFSFLIGSDGQVYEGVGWHKVGTHTIGYNSKSVGIGFIGNFESKNQ